MNANELEEGINLIIKEACVGSLREALKAQTLGANRIEYCQNLQEGGTTPSYGSLLEGKRLLSIPIMVIIRPRGGDFVYSKEEVNSMKEDIELCRKVGVQGVVLGALTPKRTIDTFLMKELILAAAPLDITFHMAFDLIENKEEALEELINLKVNRILTKGCATNAFDGKDTIKRLIVQGRGRITILPGGGVREDNFQELVDYTGANEVHGTKIVGTLA